jgi:hypothetical protein
MIAEPLNTRERRLAEGEYAAGLWTNRLILKQKRGGAENDTNKRTDDPILYDDAHHS